MCLKVSVSMSKGNISCDKTESDKKEVKSLC